MEFTFRGPIPNALRTGIRRLLPALFKHRILQMPVLQTERLVLRPFEQRDLKEISKWDEFATSPDPAAAAKEFLDYCFREYRRRGIGPWAIQRKETGAVVGNCGFPEINFSVHGGEVNCYIAPGHRRHGLATEALLALFMVGFDEFQFTQIRARCAADNLNSQGLAEKAGMKFTGYADEGATSGEKGARQKLYAISRNDIAIKIDRTVKVSLKLEAQADPGTKD
jgi:RimJ/RimL family protein N-acetyltransferase